MSNIGIIAAGYEVEKSLEKVLEPWIKLKDKYEIQISVVSCLFKDYEPGDNSKTKELLKTLHKDKKIDHLQVIDDTPLTEHEARNLALKPVKDCDFIWILDLADEFYTESQIIAIISYINGYYGQDYAWFGINFRNFILDGNYWVDEFCPPRIFKSKYFNIKLKHFYWDNDIIYDNGMDIDYKNLPNKTIPASTALIAHLTWTHENGRKKYEYQMKHFGACSYKWNYDKNLLEVDYKFYSDRGLAYPIVYNCDQEGN